MRIRAIALTFSSLAMVLAACQAPESEGEPGAPGSTAELAAAFAGQGGRWVDLSHDYSEQTLYWPTDSLGFQFEELAYGETDLGYFYSAYRFATAEHGGTHLDAPIHFARGADAVERIPLDRLIGPAVVVDVTDRVTPDYLVSVADLEAHEAEHGRIPDGAILIVRTGWWERWPDREAYLGTPLTGQAAIPDLHFPGIAPEAARWLADNRSIGALGIDTASIDFGQSTDFQTHVALYTAGIPGLENVANLGELPVTGSFVVALPMKIAGGSGAPVRIAAFIPDGG